MWAPIDDLIPFVPAFIIPYHLWYPLFVLPAVYYIFADKEEYYRYAKLMIASFALCLFICSVFPNGQNLRPDNLPEGGVFVNMVKSLYQTDTNTNVFPSLHVAGSVVAFLGTFRAKCLENKKAVKVVIAVVAVLVSVSTV